MYLTGVPRSYFWVINFSVGPLIDPFLVNFVSFVDAVSGSLLSYGSNESIVFRSPCNTDLVYSLIFTSSSTQVLLLSWNNTSWDIWTHSWNRQWFTLHFSSKNSFPPCIKINLKLVRKIRSVPLYCLYSKWETGFCSFVAVLCFTYFVTKSSVPVTHYFPLQRTFYPLFTPPVN